jgi:hypothetical protein
LAVLETSDVGIHYEIVLRQRYASPSRASM